MSSESVKTSMPLLVDLGLARRLEAADASANVEYARAHAAWRPDEGATWIGVAGGCAVYAGPASPLTQAVGLGLAGAVGEQEMERLEDFFRSRGAPATIELCPLADASLNKHLAARGYHLDGLTDKLFLPLTRDARLAPPTPDDEIHIRQAAPEEAELWAQTVAGGFSEDEGEPARPLLDIFRVRAQMREGICFLAELCGQTAAGGFLRIDAGTATLSGTSVLRRARRRGLQTALLRARLAYAAEVGCDLATVMARPGTTSHHNAERLGFRVAYTRAQMRRGLGGGD